MSASDTSTTLHNVTEVFRHAAGTYLSARSLIVLVVAVSLAMVLGRLIAAVLRKTVVAIGQKADKTENLNTVNRLRRAETLLVLSIAIIRTVLVMFALYYWWTYIHPYGSGTALIGVSTVIIIVAGATIAPALRDITAGSLMMAEQWYAVGDHIRVEPFMDLQGVVERVTLRSTRIRGLNGEVIWLNNQTIQGVRIAPKGIRVIGIELFVSDLEAGEDLIENANQRLPSGPLLVISPLGITTSTQVGTQLWHITAVAETAPGREWLIERYAIDVLKEIDAESKRPILATEPVARYADIDAERRFTRTIHNARKRPVQRRRRARKATAKKQP